MIPKTQLFLFTLSICIFWCVRAFAESLPQELKQLAIENHCSSAVNHAADADPLYLYGYLPGPKQDSAAFWCKAGTKYFLVTKTKSASDKCPSRLEWWNAPMGLSVSKVAHVSLDEFFYIAEPRKKAPRGKMTNYAPLIDSYDGVSAFFYCYDGAWLFKVTH